MSLYKHLHLKFMTCFLGSARTLAFYARSEKVQRSNNSLLHGNLFPSIPTVYDCLISICDQMNDPNKSNKTRKVRLGRNRWKSLNFKLQVMFYINKNLEKRVKGELTDYRQNTRRRINPPRKRTGGKRNDWFPLPLKGMLHNANVSRNLSRNLVAKTLREK